MRLPHNILTVFADALTLETAKILQQSGDVSELQQIYQTALHDLLQVLEAGAISEEGYRWIPGVAGKTDGSRWGVLYACYPCNILPAHHPLINGTIRKLESHLSPGGIPVNTGWLKDGLWVAMALDNLAEAQLHRGQGDAAVRYLYATLNHGTPLFSWCEERGQEAGASNCTGDLQHLWTPLAVSRFIRDALVMEEEDTLHLARGTARQWLDNNQILSARDLMTHFGKVSYELCYFKSKGFLKGSIELNGGKAPMLTLHVRLPDNKRVITLSDNNDGTVSNDGRRLIWRNFGNKAVFEAHVR